MTFTDVCFLTDSGCAFAALRYCSTPAEMSVVPDNMTTALRVSSSVESAYRELVMSPFRTMSLSVADLRGYTYTEPETPLEFDMNVLCGDVLRVNVSMSVGAIRCNVMIR